MAWPAVVDAAGSQAVCLHVPGLYVSVTPRLLPRPVLHTGGWHMKQSLGACIHGHPSALLLCCAAQDHVHGVA
jgi:hypothetical protein